MDILIFGDFVAEKLAVQHLKEKNALSHELLGYIKRADYTIVNLEAPVANESCHKITKAGPNLKTSPWTIDYLKSCEFSCVTLANNHFYDYGANAVSQTINLLEEKQIDFVGGGRNEEEKCRILYKDIGKEKVAIINCCESEFSVEHEYGSKQLDVIDVFHDIQSAKKITNVILVIVHGGHEGYQLPSPRMQKLYRFLIDAGAQAVINHHQHCYSGYEQYHGGYIYYGLGNFFFHSTVEENEGWNEGFFVDIRIEQSKISEVKEIPYMQCMDGSFEVRLMNAVEKANFASHIHQLNQTIANPNLLKKSFEEYAHEKAANYWVFLTPYHNRYLMALCKRHWLPSFLTKMRRLSIYNLIHCESHRDLLLRSLK